MSNADILQSIAHLQWMDGNVEPAKQLAVAQIGIELYNRLSGAREVDALQNQTIAAIAKYVQENPKAKREDLQKMIAKHIINFARQVDQL